MALFTIFDTTMDGIGQFHEPKKIPKIWKNTLIIIVALVFATVLLGSVLIHTVNTTSFIFKHTVKTNYVTHQLDRAGGN